MAQYWFRKVAAFQKSLQMNIKHTCFKSCSLGCSITGVWGSGSVGTSDNGLRNIDNRLRNIDNGLRNIDNGLRNIDNRLRSVSCTQAK